MWWRLRTTAEWIHNHRILCVDCWNLLHKLVWIYFAIHKKVKWNIAVSNVSTRTATEIDNKFFFIPETLVCYINAVIRLDKNIIKRYCINRLQNTTVVGKFPLDLIRSFMLISLKDRHISSCLSTFHKSWITLFSGKQANLMALRELGFVKKKTMTISFFYYFEE